MRDLTDAVMRFFTWELWGLLLMERQPEWACESESGAVTRGSQWEGNGPLHFTKGSLKHSLLPPYIFMFPHAPSSHSASHSFTSMQPPPPKHPPTLPSLWHYLVSFLSMWLAACQHPIIAYTVFLSLPPLLLALFIECWSLTSLCSICQSDNDPIACFFSSLF